MAYEYVVNGKRIALPIEEGLVAVRFKEPAPLAVRAAGAVRLGMGAFEQRIELPGERYTIFRPRATMAAGAIASAAAMAASAPDVARVAPVFRVGSKHVLASDRVIVGFDQDVKDADARVFLTRRNYTVIDQIGDGYVVRLPETVDPFKAAEELIASKKVKYAEPDFVTIGRHIPRRGTSPETPLPEAMGVPATTGGRDPLRSRQYAPTITKTSQAWSLVASKKFAVEQVRIAILDEGVDRNHEDLNVTAEYDATGNDLDQQPNAWDGHGTACAGLAGGIGKNQRGIRGIASGAQILAVRIAYSNQPNGDWVTTNSIIGRAIEWAWQNGADVLSNSWGGGAPSSLIIGAFERARTQGRAGKGCVVAIAAGNDNGPVSFPGDLPNMLTVSASNEFDEPKTPTSRDGEDWWGSNYGPEVSIAAPGVHNYTTDISGEAGYSEGGRDERNRRYNAHYTPDFNGTSSATPIVAGAAALLIAAKPTLNESQVRDALCQTAEKVGGPYSGGRHERMGFGRLNVHGAMRHVLDGSGPASADADHDGRGAEAEVETKAGERRTAVRPRR